MTVRSFWDFNVGHLLIVVGMAGSMFVLVNNINVQLAVQDRRILVLEHDDITTKANLEGYIRDAATQAETNTRGIDAINAKVDHVNQALEFLAQQIGRAPPARLK